MKRILDIFIATFVLVLLVLPLLGIFLTARMKLGSPVLFKQPRPGRYGKSFKMIKFRTMTDARDLSGKLLLDFERLTPFRSFLRSTSLDELPELWNVLKGDMSLVGPRPLLMEYLPLYSPTQARRHEVRLGITGWARVYGRYVLSWDEKFVLNVWYVDNHSFCLDLKILLMTVKKVLLCQDIGRTDNVTSIKFMRNV